MFYTTLGGRRPTFRRETAVVLRFHHTAPFIHEVDREKRIRAGECSTANVSEAWLLDGAGGQLFISSKGGLVEAKRIS